MADFAACTQNAEGTGAAVFVDVSLLPVVAVWGDIGGTLADQTDLQAELDTKGTSDFSGAYADLTGKPTLFDGVYASLSGKPTLGTAAEENVGFFATAAQGTKADTAIQAAGMTKAAVGLGNADNTSDANKPISTATQTALDLKAATASLAPVATSGVYADLTSRPTLGTAAATAIGDYATAAQGVDARTPLAHKTSHQDGGSDELSVAGLSGVLADPQPPIIGAAGNQAVAGNDARLTDSRAPTGGAGGVLSGSYPSPGFAVDMATEGELTAGLATKLTGTFPGGTTTFLRADGAFAAPAGGSGNTLYAPGSFTVATGNFAIFADELDLTGSQEATVDGTALLLVA